MVVVGGGGGGYGGVGVGVGDGDEVLVFVCCVGGVIGWVDVVVGGFGGVGVVDDVVVWMLVYELVCVIVVLWCWIGV